MKLYYSPGACSQAPHIILHETGFSHDAVKVELARQDCSRTAPTIAQINPKGSVPALELDNGEVLTENAVILQYLGDRSSSDLLPPFGEFRRYRVLEWLNYITTELHKSFAPLFKPDASDEAKKFAASTSATSSIMSNEQIGDGPVPARRHADHARRLSVRDQRLGRDDARSASTAGRTSPPSASGCCSAPSVQHVLKFEGLLERGSRGLEPRRHAPVRPHRRPAPDPGDGAQVHRRRDHAVRRRVGREAHLPARHDPRGRRARLRRDLRQRGKRRHRPRPARSGADHGGDGLWLPVDQRLHLDPQHGERG